jgi:hypothetical protein
MTSQKGREEDSKGKTIADQLGRVLAARVRRLKVKAIKEEGGEAIDPNEKLSDEDNIKFLML